MSNDVDPFASLATGLNEDARAARNAKPPRTSPLKAAKAHLGGDKASGPKDAALDSTAAADNSAPSDEESPAALRIEAAAGEIIFDQRSLVADVRDAMLEPVKRLDKPWGITAFDHQRDIAAATEGLAKEIVRRILEAVAADPERNPIRCLLVGYADKGDDIKVDLKVKVVGGEDETSAAVLALHKAKGKHVLITVASVEDYAQVDREAELLPDQPGLGFESGSDQVELSDDDLSAADLAPPIDERTQELKDSAARDRAAAAAVVVES